MKRRFEVLTYATYMWHANTYKERAHFFVLMKRDYVMAGTLYGLAHHYYDLAHQNRKPWKPFIHPTARTAS